MYIRSLLAPDGTPTRFGVSGKLWNGVLVFFDRATGSLWTQIDGRAIEGEALGERLQHFPSTFTTWSAWKRAHPATLVLEKAEDEREHTGSRYADYFDDSERLWMEYLGRGLGGVGPKDVVYGTVHSGEALAITEQLLSSRRVVNAVVGGLPVAWLADDETGFPRLIDRHRDDQVRVLEPAQGRNPAFLLREVGSGEIHGFDEFSALRVDRAYWYAWRRTHPTSAVLAD